MKRIFVSLSILFILQSAVADIMCDSATHYVAIFTTSEYECDPGQFLPANTEGCRSCPSGYTCPGGTYTFNPNESQGLTLTHISNTSMNNACANNFPTHIVGIYEPNTINLNWYDRDTLLTTTTCTYGEKITLPNITPTRPGYIFSGWQLITTPAE